MKRTLVLAAVVIVLAAAPGFCEWRFDVGAYVFPELGQALSDLSNEDQDITFIFPFPFAEANYMWGFGPAKIGVGVRAFTVIFETALWPNVIAEFELGPVALEAELGGLLFAAFGLFSDIQAGSVLIPELAGWFKLGRFFRLGGGAVGIMTPDTGGMDFTYFIGGKFVMGG